MSTTDLAALESVMTENRDMQSIAAQQGEIPNMSTDLVEKTPAFNTHEYMQALQARSGFAEHLNQVTAGLIPQAKDELRTFRNQWASVAGQLKAARLPDTLVNVRGERIEISSSLKQFANDIDQARYIRVMHALLGTETMRGVLRHCTKSNQSSKPALWLNQAIAVETKKQYVMLFAAQLNDESVPEAVRKHIEQAQEAAKALGMDKLQLIDTALKEAFGNELYGLVQLVAKSNRLPLYAVLLLIVEEIIRDRDNCNVPVTPLSIWEGIAQIEDPKPAQMAVDKMEQLTAMVQKR